MFFSFSLLFWTHASGSDDTLLQKQAVIDFQGPEQGGIESHLGDSTYMPNRWNRIWPEAPTEPVGHQPSVCMCFLTMPCLEFCFAVLRVI